MRVLVTGGTGFLGGHVVRQLKKHDVTIFARKRKGRGKFVLGDIADIGALEKAFPCDVAIHLAATFDNSDPKLAETNVGGTRNVLHLCKKYSAKQIIFMSSTAAIGKTNVAKENSKRNPKTKYEKSKRDAEDLVIGSGVNYTIIRAPVILGPSETWLSVVKAAQKGFPIIGRGNNRFHVAHVDDVARLIARAAGNKKAYGRIFHVATRDAPTYREFYRMLCSALGVQMTDKHIPVFAAKTISMLHEAASKIRGKKPKPILSRQNINRITRDRMVSTGEAKRILGFSPKYDTKTAIRQTVIYFKKAGAI